MVYLDYAATSPLLPEVMKAMHQAETRFFANASALHTPGHLAMNQIEHTRELLARLINAEPEEIIFTSGASESNNTVIRTFEGHQIETSPLEHHSIIETAQEYRGEKLPKLYSYMLVNNEIGEVLNLAGVVERAGRDKVIDCPEMFDKKNGWGKPLVAVKKGAYVHSDLTQALGKMPIDVKALGADYATFSAHKIGGPVGVGALYVRKGVPLKPLIIGGNQENKRRGGTYNTVGIVGFGAALEYVLREKTWKKYDTTIRDLRDELAERILAEIPGSSLNTDLTPGVSLPNILNASFQAAEGESIQLYLDAEEIVVSTGSACAAGDTKPSHVLMAKTGDAEVAHSSIRFSFGLENTKEDVEAVMRVLPGIIERLQQISTIAADNSR
ncbi:cysteine desulfurase family protein [Candidatus Nanosyncoccus alces]|uniref:IscS-like cysteine desulfurase n=1 Tax=Candidatus Nanosyncoccus alces TaxID=2171997 RepID=A0ABY0FLP0_9BACT|nr:cysteine desulfurase family protein [Candidatus Nanosyncoccus alces]RYC74725.1 IscS-like cysteine desulfurase [Candidatus Nanosyncoccus alces]